MALLSFATVGISTTYADAYDQGYNQGLRSPTPTLEDKNAAVSFFGNASYDAIKEEFEGKPADRFYRGLAKMHRYTLRYVSIVIIKYAKAVVYLTEKAKGSGNDILAFVILLVGNLILPIVVFAALIRGYRKS